MLGTLAIALVLYVIVGFILIYDVVFDGKVDTSLDGLSSLIQAISINLGIGGLTKVLSRSKANETDK